MPKKTATAKCKWCDAPLPTEEPEKSVGRPCRVRDGDYCEASKPHTKKPPNKKTWPAKGDAAGWEKEAREHHKALRDFTDDVAEAIRRFDKAMHWNAGANPGLQKQMLNRVMTMLEVAKDKARFFTLGDDWRKELEEKRNAGST